MKKERNHVYIAMSARQADREREEKRDGKEREEKRMKFLYRNMPTINVEPM